MNRTLHFNCLLVVTIFLVCTVHVQPVHAAVKYWVGTGTGAFNVSRNWSIYSGSGSTTTVPTAGDSMVFNAGSTVGGHITSSMTGSSIVIQSGYTGNISLSGSVVLTLSTLTIGRSSSTVIMGTNSKLILQASGTPLAGSGTLDTTTHTPNTVEYTGPATTNITAATPATAYNNLTIDPPGFARVGSMAAPQNEAFWRTAVMDSNGYAYFTGDISGAGYITKIRLSDMARVGVLTAGPGFLETSVIDTANGYAYFVSSASPSVIYKIRLSDFTLQGTLPFNAGENTVAEGGVIDAANGFAYFATCTSPSNIVKIRLSDLTRVGAIALNSGENCPEGAALYNGNLYFPTSVAFASAVKVVKVQTSDFTRVGVLTLNSDETGEVFGGTVVDATNGFLYVGTYTSPAKIVKIRLSDFTRVTGITLNTGENLASAATIDTTNGYVYFGLDTTPGQTVKIRLSDFTRVAGITFPTGVDAPISSAIDPANGFLYYGTYTNPAILTRISLGSSVLNIGTAPSQTLTVNNNLTIGDGTNVASVNAAVYNPALSILGNLTINAAGSLIAPASSAFTIAGNLINNGTFTANGGTVTLNGIAATIKLYGASLYNLVINTAKSAILRTSATITNALTIGSSATLTLNGNTLTATNANITNNGTLALGTGSVLHPATISVSPSSLDIGSSISITVTDSAQNINAASPDTITVTSDEDSFTLTETANSSGIFTATIPTTHAPRVYGNGTIENNDHCRLNPTFTFTDPEDSTDTHSSSVTITDAAVPCESGGSGGGSRTTPANISTTAVSGIVRIPRTGTGVTQNNTVGSTGNTVIDGTIKRLEQRIAKMLQLNPKSVFAKAMQKRIDALRARVMGH